MSVYWQPSAAISNLKKRAALLQQVRQFFADRNVMEVQTPLLCRTSVTDPFIESIPAAITNYQHSETYYLQTSPEYAMKRLLAAGSGDIYSLAPAFRQEERGKFHNPEFTMLEWYRVGFDHLQLMDEVDALLQCILKTEPAKKISYADLFIQHCDFNPHTVSITELATFAASRQLIVNSPITDKDTWLHLLLTHCIEPFLGVDRPCMIYHFPTSQAALAKLMADGCAARFEVYYQGIELANGFYELQDAAEQRNRFQANLSKRHELGLMPLPLDEAFLAALESGLPDCAGVALGIDRLVMLAIGAKSIDEVLTFPIDRA